MNLLCKLVGHKLDFVELIDEFPVVHCARCGYGGRIIIESVENQITTDSQYEHTVALEFPRVIRTVH